MNSWALVGHKVITKSSHKGFPCGPSSITTTSAFPWHHPRHTHQDRNASKTWWGGTYLEGRCHSVAAVGAQPICPLQSLIISAYINPIFSKCKCLGVFPQSTVLLCLLASALSEHPVLAGCAKDWTRSGNSQMDANNRWELVDKYPSSLSPQELWGMFLTLQEVPSGTEPQLPLLCAQKHTLCWHSSTSCLTSLLLYSASWNHLSNKLLPSEEPNLRKPSKAVQQVITLLHAHAHKDMHKCVYT